MTESHISSHAKSAQPRRGSPGAHQMSKARPPSTAARQRQPPQRKVPTGGESHGQPSGRIATEQIKREDTLMSGGIHRTHGTHNASGPDDALPPPPPPSTGAP